MTNINNEQKENVQYALTPFAFVAVNSERGDDELNTLCSPWSDVEDPLEENRKNSGTTKEVKMESDYQFELKVKKEIKKEDDLYEPMDLNYISNLITNTERIGGEEITPKLPLIETVGCESSKSCCAEGMEDMQMEFESICDVSKFELIKVEPLENLDENDSVDDDNDFLTSNETFESLECEAETIGPSNFQEYLTCASGLPNTKRLKIEELSVALDRTNSCSQAYTGNNHSAFHESPSPSRCCTQPTAQESYLERSKDTDEVQCEYVGSEKRFNITENVDNATCTRKESVRISRNNSSELKHFSCNVCDRSFHRNDLLKKHKCIKVVKKQFLCDICNASFGRKYSLKIHMLTHSGDKPFDCDICGTTFSQNGYLKRHKRTHDEIKPYKCDHCGASFSENCYLERHKRTHEGIKPYNCDHCGASFSENCYLKKHKRIHEKIKPYNCDLCGASFSENGNLKRHKRTHEGIKPYKCDHCGASFSENAHLKTHKRSHEGIKPFKCDHCGASFSDNGYLKRHKRIHEEIKPYNCDHCGASFSESCNLKRHIRTHDGIKPYKCDHCGASFSRNGCLKRHKRTHEGIKP